MTQERRIVVVSLDGSLAAGFVGTLAGGPTECFELEHPDGPLTIEALDGDTVFGDGLRNRLATAAGVIVVTQHGDAASVEELRRLVARMPEADSLPVCHALHREPGRMEFKISCGHCGQKLWVADAHEGRPGRCPGCKQTFLIPSQQRHIAAALQLAAETPVRILSLGDAAGAVALVNDLAALLAAQEDESHAQQMNTTMRIVIDPSALR